MTRRQCIRFAASVFWTSLHAHGGLKQEFVLIVHPSNRFEALSRSRVSCLFLRKVSRWPWGAEAAPADLTANEPVRAAFVQQVHQMTSEQLAEYWIDQRATRGISPPVEVGNVAEVKRWVAAKPGGIAYIPSSALDGTVKVLRMDP
jgi:hypothetical protein